MATHDNPTPMTSPGGGEQVLNELMNRAKKSRRYRPSSTKDALSHKDLQRIIHGIPQELRVEIAKVFAMIDDDESGSISMDELASMFRDLGKPQSTKSMRALFRVIDADANGEVDFFEFQLLFWKLQQKVDFVEEHDSITETEEERESHHQTWRQTLWDVMEVPSSSKLAMFVSMFIMALIILSTAMFLVESTVAPLPPGEPVPRDFAYFSELICVIFFTVEIALRLVSTPKLSHFFCEFMNLIDLVAILPWYMEKALEASGTEAGGSELTIIRVVRLFRIFRLFKFSRYLVWIMLLAKALRHSVLPLAMVMMVLLIVVVIFASLMYTIEKGTWHEPSRTYVSLDTNEPSMFQSIMAGIYFGFITSTTVGYGDKYPVSPWGKFVGGIMCVCGIFIMVIPISIFSNNFEIIFAEHNKTNKEKKEHVATDELRQLLSSEKPLSEMLTNARVLRASLKDQMKQEQKQREDIALNRPLRYQSSKGSLHTLQPYREFMDELTTKCHLIIDARRESLRILVNNEHKKHRQTLLMNVEDMFANWFGVPLGLLIEDAVEVEEGNR